MISSVNLYLLGSFRLEQAGQPIALARRKAASLLAYLALHPEAHAREKLAALFWGESTDADARRALRVILTDLRHALGEEAFLGNRDTLQLNPTFTLSVDAVGFKRLKDWKLEHGLIVLKELLALYQGDLLPDFYDDWLTQPRADLRALYINGLLAGTTTLRSQSEYTQAIELARKILAAEPGHESAYQHLMFCHATLGDREAVLQDFAECQRALRNELGVEPTQETKALYQRLLQQTETGSAAARLTNLPRPLTSFVGRKRERTTLQQLFDPIQPTSVRLLTLTGAGGTGKTRLAIQAGHDLLPLYPDGVWWVDFTSLAEGSLVAQQVAQALGVPEQATQPHPQQTLIDHLRTRKLLILLDNCEHLLAACAALVETLLASVPALQIMATSREPLGILGERIFATPTLSLPTLAEAQADEAALLSYEAIKLFVDRASVRLPAFHLTEQNAELIIQICQRLEGMPLALELTAAEVSAFTLAEIAAHLEKQLDRAKPNADSPSRQRSLYATIHWSYGLLNEAEQTLLRRLSVFVGGWTLDEAAQVAGGYGEDKTLPARIGAGTDGNVMQLPVTGKMIVQALLNGLADKSLVQIRQTEQGRRYALVEIIREFAQEKLIQANEADLVQQRHYQFFADFADAAHLAVQGSESDRWLARVEAEHDNVRAALRWALAQDQSNGATGSLSLHLAGGIWPFWQTRGHILEGESWLRQALAAAQAPLPTHDPSFARYQARALTGLGTMAWIKGEHTQAETLHQQALDLYKVAGDARGIAMTLNNTATAYMDAGRYPDAVALLKEGLGLAQTLEDVRPQVIILVSLGSVEQYLGNFDAARDYYTESFVLARDHGLTAEACLVQNNLGDIAMWQGDLDQSLRHYTESLAVARDINYKVVISGNLIFSALALYLLGRYPESRVNCLEAIRVSTSMSYTVQLVECLVVLGLLAEKAGLWEKAVRLLSAATANRDQLHYTFYPVMQAPYEEALALLQAQQPKENFEGIWAQGQALTLQSALAL